MKRAALLVVAAALLGCEPLVLGFGVSEVDDDDRAREAKPTFAYAPDIPPDVRALPPTLTVATTPPAGPLAGDVELSFQVLDPDSAGYSVSVWIEGRDGERRPLSLVDPSISPNIVVRPGEAAPVEDHAALVWASGVDIPGTELGVRLRLCPVDDEGNAGACATYPADGTFAVAQPDVGALCGPGSVAPVHWRDDLALVPLGSEDCPILRANDPPGFQDFAARFFVVLVNEGADAAGFTVSGPDLPEPPPLRPPPPPRDPVAPVEPAAPPSPCGCTPDLFEADVGAATRTFFLREGPGDGDARSAHLAVLRAFGDGVAIWVDQGTPDPPSAAELQPVVDIYDLNIAPRLDGLFGAIPDVDGDCRADVVISHRVNVLTALDDDPANDDRVVHAFVEPESDLVARDGAVHATSNEGETIFAAAPDPAALWSDGPVPVDAWLAVDLPGALAVAGAELASWAAHTEAGCSLLDPAALDDAAPQAAWLDRGLALLIADLTGFGSVAHEAAWTFLDAPHLVDGEAPPSLTETGGGGAYLLARYLWELEGDGLFAALAASALRGAAAVDELVGDDPAAFRRRWATAPAVAGRARPGGAALVGAPGLPHFHPATTIALVDPEAPAPGEPYGAHGHQQGFDPRGANRTFLGGTTATPEEIPERRVLGRGPDPLVFHPDAPFFGTVPPRGFTVVEVADLGVQSGWLLVHSTGATLTGYVVRLRNERPEDPRLRVAPPSGAQDTTHEALGTISDAGGPVRVIADVDVAAWIASSTPDGGPIEVLDTDRYRFSLAAAGVVAVSLNRRYVDLDEGVELDDPFLAVAPAEDVPDAGDGAMWGFGPATGPCGDPSLIDYPAVMPDWLAAQANLVAATPPDAPYTALAAVPGSDPSWGCALDQDADGILDVDEPSPTTLIHQIVQRQAEHLAADPDHYVGGFDALPEPLDVSEPFFGPEFVDFDSRESVGDGEPTRIPALGLGGRSTAFGEDAVWAGTLPAGEYVIVVGAADGGTGPYDLEVRLLP